MRKYLFLLLLFLFIIPAIGRERVFASVVNIPLSSWNITDVSTRSTVFYMPDPWYIRRMEPEWTDGYALGYFQLDLTDLPPIEDITQVRMKITRTSPPPPANDALLIYYRYAYTPISLTWNNQPEGWAASPICSFGGTSYCWSAVLPFGDSPWTDWNFNINAYKLTPFEGSGPYVIDPANSYFEVTYTAATPTPTPTLTPTPTPTPVLPHMAGGVQSATQGLILGAKTSALESLGNLIPMAAVVLISVAVLYFSFRFFFGFTGIGGGADDNYTDRGDSGPEFNGPLSDAADDAYHAGKINREEREAIQNEAGYGN